ncbi:MAG TPA: hypothetical protein V6D20_24685, partial [Candidatus Obscuribacterales bacterium]
NEHFVPKELGLRVKIGDTVAPGQQLSQGGALNPQDLLDATGDINLVRNTMIDELTKAYGGQRIKRRIFETVVKPMTDRAKVIHAGDADKLFNVYPGEIHQVNQLNTYNEKLKLKGLKPIKYESALFGIIQLPHQQQDFIGQLTHERLKDTMKNAPATGKSTNIFTGHPIAQLALKQFSHVEDIKNPRTKLF